jgi:hypothetical protein
MMSSEGIDPTGTETDTPDTDTGIGVDTNTDREQPEFHTERWVYLGPRQGSGTKTYYSWREESGDELGYDKVKARVFGGLYTLLVRRFEDRIIVRADSVQFTGQRAEDAAAIEVHALEAERQVAVTRLERNAKRTQTLDDALTDVIEIAKGLKAYSDRRALLDYISSKVHSA